MLRTTLFVILCVYAEAYTMSVRTCFHKHELHNKLFSKTIANSVASRIKDTRLPVSHVHANITYFGEEYKTTVHFMSVYNEQFYARTIVAKDLRNTVWAIRKTINEFKLPTKFGGVVVPVNV